MSSADSTFRQKRALVLEQYSVLAERPEFWCWNQYWKRKSWLRAFLVHRWSEFSLHSIFDTPGQFGLHRWDWWFWSLAEEVDCFKVTIFTSISENSWTRQYWWISVFLCDRDEEILLFHNNMFCNSLTPSFFTNCQTDTSRLRIGQNIVFAVSPCVYAGRYVCFLRCQSHVVWKGSKEGPECLDWSECNTSTADV